MSFFKKYVNSAWKRLVKKNGLVILAYHRVCDVTDVFYDRNISAIPEEFRAQMEYLKANYNVISGEQVNKIYDQKSEIPEKSIMITFDDGFKDTIKNAMPVLVNLALPAVVFVATDFLGDYVPWEDELAFLINMGDLGVFSSEIPEISARTRMGVVSKDRLIYEICRDMRSKKTSERKIFLDKLYSCSKYSKTQVKNAVLEAGKGMMDIQDLNKWICAGLEVGSHTCSHPQLSNIGNIEAEKEMRSSKSQLEQLTGKEISIFAYPYGMKGYYDRGSVRLVERSGYKCAVSLRGGLNTLGINKYDLKRMAIAPNVDFKKACEGHHFEGLRILKNFIGRKISMYRAIGSMILKKILT